MNPFDAASPFDARYYFADAGFFARLHPYVSEVAQVRYLARVEAAVAQTLADDLGLYPPAVAAEIVAAAAAEVMNGQSVSILEGNTFVVSDRAGNIDASPTDPAWSSPQ